MLGLADKSKIINLLKEILKGNAINAINILKELFVRNRSKILLKRYS